MTVVDFQKAKQDRAPSTSGQVVCLFCNYRFEAAVPCTYDEPDLECPCCNTHRTVWDHNFSVLPGVDRFVCLHCQSERFTIQREGPRCIGCGFWHAWDEVLPRP